MTCRNEPYWRDETREAYKVCVNSYKELLEAEGHQWGFVVSSVYMELTVEGRAIYDRLQAEWETFCGMDAVDWTTAQVAT